MGETALLWPAFDATTPFYPPPPPPPLVGDVPLCRIVSIAGWISRHYPSDWLLTQFTHSSAILLIIHQICPLGAFKN
uniref:Uncharacterized protein n=1 Tax=Heterorhabditis bacteriophora TaxID=37862 RepID=A0A1I7X1R2_HETBA